jgi:exodeoxyribonuclease VII large subunit
MSAKKYSVTEITSLIKQTLETGYADISVEGELSNFKTSSLGHLYFSLKDRNAMISCVMFKFQARGNIAGSLKDGMLILARGRVSVYEARGNYQLICTSIEKEGEGELLARLEQRKRALFDEGLFDEAHKKAIPRFPLRVGVVSSPTGAAVYDILNVLGRRAGGSRVIVLPCLVQGQGAADEIAARIAQANFWRLADVLIVGRGGGSLEDLLAFSEEKVVRAIYESEIPVVSAVGHEIDSALSDFAADLRAPTPSAAAELVSQNWEDVLGALNIFVKNLQGELRGRVRDLRRRLDRFSKENLTFDMRRLIQPEIMQLDSAKDEILAGIKGRVENAAHRLHIAKTTLETANPLDILRRGYAVVKNRDTGEILRDSASAQKSAPLHIRLHKGELNARVE